MTVSTVAQKQLETQAIARPYPLPRPARCVISGMENGGGVIEGHAVVYPERLLEWKLSIKQWLGECNNG
ncbi:MAG: hypothetical protein FWE97_03360 [Dehalococcoidia bacterium]|nr:hypothetical protein [Dehalococcoidia bacterium]